MDPQSWFIADSTLSSHSANISSYRLQQDLQSLAKAHSRVFLMTYVKTQTSLCTLHFHLSCTCSPSFPPFLLSVTSSSFLEVGLAHARLVALACDLGVIFGRCHLALFLALLIFVLTQALLTQGAYLTVCSDYFFPQAFCILASDWHLGNLVYFLFSIVSLLLELNLNRCCNLLNL